jgi:cytochrome P450
MAVQAASRETLDQQIEAWLGRRDDLIQDPYPFFRRLLEEAPVFTHASGTWVSRYADCERISRDYQQFSMETGLKIDAFVPAHLNDEQAACFRRIYGFYGLWMTSYDPPEHARLRTLVHRAFTPRRVAEMESEIHAITETLVARARERGTIDVVEDYALGIPTSVICSMLGVPESDWEKVHYWSSRMADFMGDDYSVVEETARCIDEFRLYVRGMVEERAGSESESDLLAALVHAELEGDRLTPEELEAMVILLVFAGHETTSAMISNGLYHLWTHPDQLALLQNDLSFMPQALEELLRYDTSVQKLAPRLVKEDVALSGVEVPAGTIVIALSAAADRDPRAFEDPDTLNILRPSGRHLAFAIGPHYCLGQALARLEGRIGLDAFLRAFPDAEIIEDVTWRPNIQLRRVESLNVNVA